MQPPLRDVRLLAHRAGGAAALLGVSRQTIHTLLKRGEFRAFRSDEEASSDLPKWVYEDRFDIEARANGDQTKDQMRLMMRALLMERFKLQFHHEMKEVSGFALLVSKGGLKIEEDHGENSDGPSMRNSPAGMLYRKTPLSRFANFLSGPAGGPVVDKTGLTGTFSFTFQPPRSSDPASPSIFL